MLIWSAMLVTVARYAGAFVASDMGTLNGWVSDAITISMGVTGPKFLDVGKEAA